VGSWLLSFPKMGGDECSKPFERGSISLLFITSLGWGGWLFGGKRSHSDRTYRGRKERDSFEGFVPPSDGQKECPFVFILARPAVHNEGGDEG